MERSPMFMYSRIKIMKMTILPKAIYMLNAIPNDILHKDRKINPEVI
jgi:hypothetical protein